LPAQPAWFDRLAEIVHTLRALPEPHLDRQAVEALFRVRQRRARQIMTGLPAIQVGNAVAVSRIALIARLEATTKEDRFQWEISRRARVTDSIETIRKQSAARRVLIPAPPPLNQVRMVNAISGVELKRGELRICFQGAEDLASKLFQLSQAMANDWNQFTAHLDG
jgi:hypothetical protein